MFSRLSNAFSRFTEAQAFRMLLWLAAGLTLYSVSTWLGPEHPQAQVTLYKLGHVTTLAYVGYWISRQALGRVVARTDSTRVVARAIVIGSAMIAGALGL